MRVLHVVDHLTPSETRYASRVHAIMRHQKEVLKYHVQAITHQNKAFLSPASQLMTAQYGADTHAPWSTIHTLEKKVLDKITAFNADLIHAHSPIIIGMAGWRAAKQAQLPFVYEYHGATESLLAYEGVQAKQAKALEGYLLERADSLITTSAQLQEDLFARLKDKKTINVIPMALDISDMRLPNKNIEDLKKSLNIQDRFVFGYLGALHEEEGVMLLIQAMHGLIKRLPHVCLVIVGSGVADHPLKALVDQLNLNNRVKFVNPHLLDNPANYYAMMDVCVFPKLSKTSSNPLPSRRPLEAMAQGVLTVASDLAEHRSLIQSGKTGLLFSPEDPEALTNLMFEIIYRGLHRGKLVAQAKQYVAQERSWHRIVKEYLHAYEQAFKQAALRI